MPYIPWLKGGKKVWKKTNHAPVVCDVCPCCPECVRHQHFDDYRTGYRFSVSGIPCTEDCETGTVRTWSVSMEAYHQRNPTWWTCMWSVKTGHCRSWYYVDEKCVIKELARTLECDESSSSGSRSSSKSHGDESSSSGSQSGGGVIWQGEGYYRVFSCGTQYTPFFGALTPDECGMQVEPLPEFEAFQQYCVTKADLDSLLTSPYVLHDCTGETIEAAWDDTDSTCKLKVNGQWRSDYYSCFRPVKVCYSQSGSLPWYCTVIDTCTPPQSSDIQEDDIQ